MLCTTFSTAKLKGTFSACVDGTTSTSSFSCFPVLGIQLPPTICSLSLAREKFWDSLSFHHQEASSQWLRFLLHYNKMAPSDSTVWSRFVNLIRYQNIHVVNVQRMFPLRQGVCLITQETWRRLTHGNAILAYATILKRIFSRRCGVFIEGHLGSCVTQALLLFSVLTWIWPWKVDGQVTSVQHTIDSITRDLPVTS